MVSEMVGSKPQLWDTGKSRLRRVPVAGVEHNAVQLAGTDPQQLADAARSHVDEGADVIDLNFGCPAKKVCRKAAGSALLADIDHMAHLIEAVAQAVAVPVTVKTRLGLLPHDGLGVQAARAAQNSGARMLVIHARSRACRFVGAVNYAAVRPIKQAVAIPVLVNGDICDRDSLAQALRESGADGVMIGRAAIGQPWIFRQLTDQPMPSVAEQWQLMDQQLCHMHEFYGDTMGVRIARKHVQAFLNHQDMGQCIAGFMRLQQPQQQRHYLHKMSEEQSLAA